MFTVLLIIKFYIILKSILNLEGVQELNKSEQSQTMGGNLSSTSPQYTPEECSSCGGYPVGNGRCFGTESTHECLSGEFE